MSTGTIEKSGMSKELRGKYAGVLDSKEKAASVEDFEPFMHHIVVEPLPKVEKVGAILLPIQAQERQSVGWVRRISPLDQDGPFEVGDLVLFAKGAGTDVEFDGKAMQVLQYHSREEGEILGRWPKLSKVAIDTREALKAQ